MDSSLDVDASTEMPERRLPNCLAARFKPYSIGGLWSLLATITLRKCGRRIQRFGIAGSDVGREIRTGASDNEMRDAWEAVSRGPQPEHAAVLHEMLDEIMRGLDDLRRQIVVLRLQGFTVPEISQTVARNAPSSVHYPDVKGDLRKKESATA